MCEGHRRPLQLLPQRKGIRHMAGNLVLDVIVEPRYDTNFIPTAGTQQILFFANPIGAGVSVWATASSKTLADTNMDLAGPVAARNNFVVLAFRLLPPFNMTIADATLAPKRAAFGFTPPSQD